MNIYAIFNSPLELPKHCRNCRDRTLNSPLRMSPQDWEALKNKASQLGMTRTEFFTQIARREIKLEHGLLLKDKQLLGEFIGG
ncbi:hypothetical protein [Nostoc sp.]|uniref:hypothetical protein n=1 Tax=Nostoc sp. TaxID=1180 RepID=UPI002FF551C1